jgi:WD40 repeat protein
MLSWKVFKKRVNWIAFAPDSASLLVCGDVEGMKLLDGFTGVVQWGAAKKQTLFWHGTFTPDGQKTVAVEGGQIIVRRADNGDILGKVGRAIGVFTVVDNQHVVAVGHGMDSTSMRLFDLNGQAVWSKTLQYLGGIRQLRLSPDGGHLAAVNNYEALLFDVAARKIRAKFPDSKLGQGNSAGLDFSPDSRWFVFAARTQLHVVNTESAECVKSVTHQGKALQEIAMTPNGQRLLTVDLGTTVTEWDATTWKPVKRYDWKIGPLFSVAVSPDGFRAAVGSTVGNVLVWDLQE